MTESELFSLIAGAVAGGILIAALILTFIRWGIEQIKRGEWGHGLALVTLPILIGGTLVLAALELMPYSGDDHTIATLPAPEAPSQRP